MARKPLLEAVNLWVTKLAHLTSGGKTPATKQQIGVCAMALASELPLTAFTEASLHHVAEGCEYFPSYSVMLTALRAWHETERLVALASPVSVKFQEYMDEKRHTDAYKNRIADRLAAAKSDWQDPNKVRASVNGIGRDHPHRMRLGRMLAALVRRHAPENVGHLPPEFLS